MARALRIQQPGAWYHVTARGNERKDIFRDDPGRNWADFRNRHGDWGRDLALFLGRKRCGLSLKELGAAVGGLDYRSVASAIARYAQQTREDPRLARLTQRADLKLQNAET